MRRRQFLKIIGIWAAMSSLDGCLDGGASATDPTSQSGSGSPCANPRNIDYNAVSEYRDNAVYLKNSASAAYTACVTVTEADRTPEESDVPPPALSRMGYAVQPEMEVEIFSFDEAGRYTVEVSVDSTTATGAFDLGEAAFSDGTTRITTFEITGPETIQINREVVP